MYMWRIVAIASIVLSILIIIILVKKKYLKIEVIKQYEDDPIIKTDKENKKYDNYVYKTLGETNKYIDKYIISINKNGRKDLLCHYMKKHKLLVYYVVCYDDGKKAFATYKVVDKKLKDNSPIMHLPYRCAYVNIIVEKVNEKIITKEVIMPQSKQKAKKFVLLETLLMFFMLIALKQIIVEVIAKFFLDSFLGSLKNLILSGVIVLLAVINYFIAYKIIKHRNEYYTGGIMNE